VATSKSIPVEVIRRQPRERVSPKIWAGRRKRRSNAREKNSQKDKDPDGEETKIGRKIWSSLNKGKEKRTIKGDEKSQGWKTSLIGVQSISFKQRMVRGL